MAKKYVVDLNGGEKADLVALIQKGRSGARKSNEQTFCFWRMPENQISKLPNFCKQAG